VTTWRTSSRASPGCGPRSTTPSKVDETALKRAGAHGVVRSGNVVQVVVGPEAENLADDIEDLR
jgi:PTS system N-acetylglucosamine-specific IIB component